MNSDRIDILLAAYNGEQYIREQIGSVFSQTYGNVFIYARDDGSTDRTPSILREYQLQNPGRFEVLTDGAPTGSAKQNFFELMTHAKSDYVMFADQDDIWEPDKIQKTYDAMKHAEKRHGKELPILVHTDLCVVNMALSVISPSLMHMQKLNPKYATLNRLLVQNNVTGCTAMVNRALLAFAGEYDPRMIMHDWWLALIAAEFGEIVYIDEPLVKYRQHGKNDVGAKDVRSAGYYKQKLSAAAGIRQSIRDTYMQASLFLERFGDKAKDREMIAAFVELENSNLFSRIARLNKYKLYKNGLYRKIGQIVYG
jgi:glycosyltransferase involved in cell wall biosynthesis